MGQKVFSEHQGKYGGNQNHLLQQWQYASHAEKNQLRQFISETVKTSVTDSYITNLLTKLANQGCGYVAGTSLILADYEEKGLQAKFEHDYGIPFYTWSGEVNFSQLLLLFYLQERYRRHVPLTRLQFPFPYPGVRASDLQVNIWHFSQRHGQALKGEHLKNISPTRLRDQLANGKIITLTCYFSQMTLLSGAPNLYHDSQINFHTVMLTDYDAQVNKFVVSSWGRRYYLAELPVYGAYYAY